MPEADVKQKVQLIVRELDGLNKLQVELILGCVQEEINEIREFAPLKSLDFVISS